MNDGNEDIILNTASSSVVNVNKNKLYWYSKNDSTEDNNGYNILTKVNIYDIDTDELVEYDFNIQVYRMIYEDDYLIISGREQVNYNYVILCKNTKTGENLIISNTQNNLVTFAYYDNAVYYFEPSEKNNLYKYDLCMNKKQRVTDKIEDFTSIGMKLHVNKNGIFFTKASIETDFTYSKLYKYNLNTYEIECIGTDVSELFGLAKYGEDIIFYCDTNNNIIEFNTKTLEKRVIINYKHIANISVQNDCIVVKSFSEPCVDIIEINSGKLLRKINI